MEFTIACPVDGSIEVGLEDIDNVVLRDSDRADITFVCPHCGSEITVTAVVPAFLMAAIEALADEGEAASINGLVVVSSETTEGTEDASGSAVHEVITIDDDDPRLDAYCEYFRRQLDSVASVSDALDEIDHGDKQGA